MSLRSSMNFQNIKLPNIKILCIQILFTCQNSLFTFVDKEINMAK